jgi:hypothetical protein
MVFDFDPSKIEAWGYRHATMFHSSRDTAFRKVRAAEGFNMFAADLRDQWPIDARHYAVV